MTTAQADTVMCGETLDSAIGTITCDRPPHDDGRHEGGDRTYWTEAPMRPSDETLVATTSVEHLSDILEAVTPFMTEYDHPVFETVRVEAGRGVITATASNRYAVAHARGEASGTLTALHIDRHGVAELAYALEAVGEEHRLVSIYLGAAGQVTFAGWGSHVTVPVHAGDGWPAGLSALFAATGTAGAPTGQVCVNPQHIAAMAPLRERRGGRHALRLSFTGSDKPVRAEIGDWFTALIMPLVGGSPRATVPFGLPAVADGQA